MTDDAATPRAWDLAAEGYGAFIAPWFAAYAEEALDRLAPSPARGAVLDVGAGPGTLSLCAAARGLRVTALDFSAAMLAELGRRATQRAGAPPAAVRGDGVALPFAAGVFDACFSIFAVVFFASPARGLAEMCRVLRPGGGVGVTSWQPLADTPFLYELIAATAAEEPSFSFFLEDECSRPGELEEALAEAGFVEVVVRPVTHATSCGSLDDALARIARSTPPFVVLRRRLGEPAWARLWSAVRARIAPDFGEGPQRLAYPAWLATGRKPRT
jgi:ubiquinone/menaquinone biosynthesis C-methylase UbiE